MPYSGSRARMLASKKAKQKTPEASTGRKAPRLRQLARSPRLSRVPVGRWRSISRQTAVTATIAISAEVCQAGPTEISSGPASWQPVKAEA